MKYISIQFIPHSQQLYDTPGDWQAVEDVELSIQISQLPQQFELLLAIHELVEAWLCYFDHVTTQAVDSWDMGTKWAERGFAEPGDDPLAPYHAQHLKALEIEWHAARVLGIDWEAYSAALASLTHPAT